MPPKAQFVTCSKEKRHGRYKILPLESEPGFPNTSMLVTLPTKHEQQQL
jgi:hypothetical protein